MELLNKSSTTFTIICPKSEDLAIFKELATSGISCEYIHEGIDQDSTFTIIDQDATKEQIDRCLSQAKASLV